MSWVAVGVAGFQMISSFQQAEMVRRQAKIQKEIDDFNAGLAEYDGWQVKNHGETQVARYQGEVDKSMAAARVSAAAEGVDISPGSGSLSEVVAENQLNAAANIEDIQNQTREKALGYTRQAQSIRMGSRIGQSQASTQASSIQTGGIMNAAATGVKAYAGSGGGSTKMASTAPSGYSVPNPGSQSLTTTGYLSGNDQPLGSYLGDYSLMP